MTTAAPKVSIVLPVYNGERFLAKSIDSCLAQTLQNFELIIVDDCSTDSSPEIIKKYAARDSRIQVIRNTRNQKLPNSLNIGFAHARGEYLAWTSDDNEYYPDALATLAAELDADAKIGLAFANFVVVFEEEGKAPKIARSRKRIPGINVPFPDTVGGVHLYRASVAAQTHGYDDHWRIVEDYEYFWRLYFLSEFKYVDKILYKYRWHDSSLSTAAGGDDVQHRLGLAQIHHIEEMKRHPGIGRRMLAGTYYRIAKRMRTCPKCRHLVTPYLLKAIAAYPLILFRAIEKRIRYY